MNKRTTLKIERKKFYLKDVTAKRHRKEARDA